MPLTLLGPWPNPALVIYVVNPPVTLISPPALYLGSLVLTTYNCCMMYGDVCWRFLTYADASARTCTDVFALTCTGEVWSPMNWRQNTNRTLSLIATVNAQLWLWCSTHLPTLTIINILVCWRILTLWWRVLTILTLETIPNKYNNYTHYTHNPFQSEYP